MNQEGNRQFDIENALQRVGDDRSLLRELALLFLDHLPELWSRICHAIESNNPQELADAAHSLKGTLANFTQGLAWQLSAQLERLARDGQLENARAILLQLEQAVAELRREIQIFLSNRTD